MCPWPHAAMRAVRPMSKSAMLGSSRLSPISIFTTVTCPFSAESMSAVTPPGPQPFGPTRLSASSTFTAEAPHPRPG